MRHGEHNCYVFRYFKAIFEESNMIVGSSNVDSKHIPFVSMLIILLCIVFFAKSYTLEVLASKERAGNFQSYMSGEPSSTESLTSVQEFYDDFGFQMSDFSDGGFSSLLTHMFIHAGIMHILGNMLAFWAFAVAIENLFGSVKFAIFFVVCGIVACLAQGFCDVESAVPLVGASGAVAGTMGAYVVLFGGLGKVKFWVYRTVLNIPAPVFALCWLGSQVMSVQAGGVSSGGVAIVAHLAGFGAGALIAMIVKSEVSDRIKSENGELKIESKEVAAPLQEEQILAQLLESQPFGDLVEALGNPDVSCPRCDGSLDLLNPVGDRLVRCRDCCQMTFVDEAVLAGTLPAGIV